MLVTDMIWTSGRLPTVDVLPDVLLMERRPGERSAVRVLVQENAPQFLKFYDDPPETTRVYGIERSGRLVGTVLLEDRPRAAETRHDGALGALVVSKHMNGQGIGSAAIVRCCETLAGRGFDRVIAEWVASVPLYERLGFDVWKHREIRRDGPSLT